MTAVQVPTLYDERHLADSLTLPLPYLSLGDLPTPTHAAPRLGAAIGHSNLWIKRDDLSSHLYGGNKVRKLEYLLGDAVRRGHSTVLTFGAMGSNHVLATAVHASRCGIGTLSIQHPRPIGRYTDLTMLATIAHATNVRTVASKILVPFVAGYYYFRSVLRRDLPYWISLGGSSVIGSIGYLVAAFELKRQVEAGVLSEPERVYVPLGSCGTAAGLLAGFHLARMRTRVIAVRVTRRSVSNAYRVASLANSMLRLLIQRGWRHGALPLRAEDLTIIDGQLGEGYGVTTRSAEEAIRLAAETEGLILEETYTGKTLAGLIHDVRSHNVDPGKPILFWHTYGGLVSHLLPVGIIPG